MMLLKKPLSVLFLRRNNFCSTLAEKYHYEELLLDHVSRKELIIKPSSPHHPATYKLSILDQISTPYHSPFLLFYPHNDHQVSVDEKLAVLKASLSKTLTRFYPLAGRIRNQTSVDCNDDGALYSEVKVCSHEMMDVLQPPKFELLHKLLPCQHISKEPLQKLTQVHVQANVFICGGIALAITMSHKLVDGVTFSTFLKAWADIAHGNLSQEIHNDVDNIAASRFPANELCSFDKEISFEIFSCKEGCRSLIKRFVFGPDTITILREKARSEQVPNPTRSEVISGIVWKHAMNAYKVKNGNERPSIITNAVNVRHRLNPKLAHNAIGNIVLTARANYDPKRSGMNTDLSCLVSLLRESVDQVVNPAFLDKLQGEEGVAQILKSLEEQKESLYSPDRPIVFAGSSVSNMGFYQVDFGWGKPLWVSIGSGIETYFTNMIFQMETRNGDGIEVSIILDEDELEILENDREFMTYATLNPDVKP